MMADVSTVDITVENGQVGEYIPKTRDINDYNVQANENYTVLISTQ